MKEGGKTIRIIQVEKAGDVAALKKLFMEYERSLDGHLCFKDFETEMAGLPGDYGAPQGVLLIAYAGESAVGCVAMRPLVTTDNCELKRLYVRPDYQGQGLGRRLAEKVVEAARKQAYRHVCLNTLPEMAKARALYRDLGFNPVTSSEHKPVPGAIFMMKSLVDGRGNQ